VNSRQAVACAKCHVERSETSPIILFAVEKNGSEILRFAQDGNSNDKLLDIHYLELVLRVVVETRSSDTSFDLPMASTSLPV